MCKRYHFCACAGECLLKDAEQNLQKKSVTSQVLKVKTLVISLEFDIIIDIWKMYISKLTKYLTSVIIFHYHLFSWFKLQIHIIGGTSDLSLVVYTVCQARIFTQAQWKITHINFVILNSNVIVIYLRFVKSTYFHAGKQESWKQLHSLLFIPVYKMRLFSSKKTVSKGKYLSESLTLQNLLKSRKYYLQKSFQISQRFLSKQTSLVSKAKLTPQLSLDAPTKTILSVLSPRLRIITRQV